MGNKIVLVSDDTNFFEYIRTKLELRKSDEIFTFSFDSIPEKLQFVNSAVIIVNSENVREKTLDLLNLLKENMIKNKRALISMKLELFFCCSICCLLAIFCYIV